MRFPGYLKDDRLGTTREEYHVHRNIFRGSSLPSRSHLYIYIPGASYLYVDIFRPDETLPRIIKLAKYFRATTVITQALLVLLPFSPRRFARMREPPEFRQCRGGKQSEISYSRNTSAHLSRTVREC